MRDGRRCGASARTTEWSDFVRKYAGCGTALFVDSDEVFHSNNPAHTLWKLLQAAGSSLPPPQVVNTCTAPPQRVVDVADDHFWQRNGESMMLHVQLLQSRKLRELHFELEAKEKVLQGLARYRSTSLVYWLFDPAMRVLGPRVESKWRETKALYWNAFSLRQHLPRPTQLMLASPPTTGGPRITVVTPSFQQGRFLEQTVQSVLGQHYDNLDYRVQDGGSMDGSVAILERYAPRLTHWESRAGTGQAQAINRGFRGSTGDILCWLNSDDLLLPGALAAVAEYFANNPDVDVVYGHRILIDENAQEIGRWIMPAHDPEVLAWADLIPQETLFWRRSVWDKIGAALDESFQFALDWDMLLRFQEVGANVVRIPHFLGAFRVHPQQKTTSQIHTVGQKEMCLLRTRWLRRDVSHAEIHHATASFFFRAKVCQLLYRLGVMRVNGPAACSVGVRAGEAGAAI